MQGSGTQLLPALGAQRLRNVGHAGPGENHRLMADALEVGGSTLGIDHDPIPGVTEERGRIPGGRRTNGASFHDQVCIPRATIPPAMLAGRSPRMARYMATW